MPWSMCALLKKPKIPMLVINAIAITAGTKYSLSNKPARCQYLRNQTVVVILASSSAEPMMMTGTTAPAKIVVKPIILYHAAILLRINATNRVRLEKLKILLSIVYLV